MTIGFSFVPEEDKKAIIYKFIPTVIQNRITLRVPTEAPAKAGV